MLSDNFQSSEYAQYLLMKESASADTKSLTEKKNPVKPINTAAMKSIQKILLFTSLFFTVQIQNAYSFADIISLTAASGNYSDETIIRFHEEATCEFDGDWDALKLSNGGNTPNFYSELNAKRYAINSVPQEFEELSVPLNLKVAFTGSYTISTQAINDSYDSSIIVILEDKFLNINQVLEENDTYSFDASTSDAVDRFVLHFQKKAPYMGLINGLNSKIEADQVQVEINSGYAIVSFQNTHSQNAILTLLNADGKILYNNDNTSTDLTTEIPLYSNSTGTIYIVTVIVDNNIVTKKFYN